MPAANSQKPHKPPRGPVGSSEPLGVLCAPQQRQQETLCALPSTPRNHPGRTAACPPPGAGRETCIIPSFIRPLFSLKTQQVLTERPLPARPCSRQVLELPLWGSGVGGGDRSHLSTKCPPGWKRADPRGSRGTLNAAPLKCFETTAQPAPLPEPRVQGDGPLAPVREATLEPRTRVRIPPAGAWRTGEKASSREEGGGRIRQMRLAASGLRASGGGCSGRASDAACTG